MGPYLSQPNKTKNTVTGQSRTGNTRYVACGMQGWRTSMEDAHLAKMDLAEDTSLFGVFDGHGGEEVAKFVEERFSDELLKNQKFTKGDISGALTETFMRMDQLLESKEGQEQLTKIRERNNSDQFGAGESQAGCTANVALMYKNKLYVANAGDSRAVLCSKRKARAMSKDHKPDDELEKARIQKAGGYVNDGRINGNLNLSRAIGDLEYKSDKTIPADQQLIIAKPDIKEVELDIYDQFIIMGCDGIWERWSEQEMCDFILERLDKGIDTKEIVENILDANLAQTSKGGIGCDNMTCVLILLNQNLQNK